MAKDQFETFPAAIAPPDTKSDLFASQDEADQAADDAKALADAVAEVASVRAARMSAAPAAIESPASHKVVDCGMPTRD